MRLGKLASIWLSSQRSIGGACSFEKTRGYTSRCSVGDPSCDGLLVGLESFYGRGRIVFDRVLRCARPMGRTPGQTRTNLKSMIR